MNMDKVKKGANVADSPKTERLLKLFFYRQITYEFSGYALLVICIAFLIGCIYIFIEAATYVSLSINEEKLTVSQYLISLVSIRAGIALVIFFICQVLLKLYRYCLRFTAFYTGLFDALFIHEDLKKDFADAVQFFAIKEGLEEAPESPSDKVIEILKQLK
jgi:ABC-type multidrug transport system fused ATPase/permease subunit